MSEHDGELPPPERPSTPPQEPRRTPTAAVLDEGFDRLRVEVLARLTPPPLESVVHQAARRRRRHRAASSLAVAAAVLAGGVAADQLPRLLPGHDLSHSTRVTASMVDSSPLPVSSVPPDLGWTAKQLPLSAAEMPSIWGAYGPWRAATAEAGAPLAADPGDQPGCLAGSILSLGSWDVRGADYVPANPAEFGNSAGQVQAYQYVLSFADNTTAATAAEVLGGRYGCKGGHGGLTRVAADEQSTVLHEAYNDSAGPVSYVEEFTVAVHGVRVGVIGVRRSYRPGELGFGTPLGVDQQFGQAAQLLRTRLLAG
ncbi:hypothetical protein ACFYNO_10135 [Kitasatospora sp. NPDC006697]|uniref:hypothetical protein n=1 Tax=Kitasatospora sp. NPDC006697 TaxID=3364020 RepID=UPI0036C25601